MRHRLAGKELSRTSSHRKALRRNMAASLFEHGAIRTTEAKAKELRRFVEKLISTARKNTLHARRQILAKLGDRLIVSPDGEVAEKTVVQKLFDEIAPRYVDRPGGYTRIIRLAERRIGDAGIQVLLQLVEESAGDAAGGSRSRRKARAAKLHKIATDSGAVTAVAETAAVEPTDEDQVDAEMQEAPADETSESAGDAEQADDAATDEASDDEAKE